MHLIGKSSLQYFFFLYLLVSAPLAAADAESKLKALGIELYEVKKPTNNFIQVVQTGNLLFVSGHGPKKADGSYIIGKVGKELTIEQGAEAARLMGVSILSSVKNEIGDLSRVSRFVKVLGMVNATEDFKQHAQVINGFSDFMVEVFGESGRHARSAVGMQSLPAGFAVEIEVIIELKD